MECDVLVGFLRRSDLVVPDEMEVYRAARRWLLPRVPRWAAGGGEKGFYLFFFFLFQDEQVHLLSPIRRIKSYLKRCEHCIVPVALLQIPRWVGDGGKGGFLVYIYSSSSVVFVYLLRSNKLYVCYQAVVSG